MKKYKVVLWMVEAEDGLTKEQIIKSMDLLEEDNRGYMTIEIESHSNSIAIGFISTSYYDELSYKPYKIMRTITTILEDWDNESEDCEYILLDGTVVFIGCYCTTI